MFDKYQLIDRMITEVDTLADARGAEKCTLIIELIQQLGVLRKGLKADEDAARVATAIAPDEPPEVENNGEAMEV